MSAQLEPPECRSPAARATMLLALLLTAAAAAIAVPDEPRRLHTLFSVECTHYFDWQTVGLMESYRLSRHPGPITRLLSCTDEELRDYKGMDLAPTHVVPSMSRHPRTGDWYPAINKPAGVVHWLNHSKDARNVDWVVILDADMVIRKPLLPWELGTERGKPVSASYGYLFGCDNILAQLHTVHPEYCDKVGGLISMHIDDLRAMAPLWLSKTEEVREDRAHWATNITGDIYASGWISEMYGYSFGAAEVGLRHKINDDVMIYPGYTPRSGVEPLLLHYGLRFTVGNWSFSKADHRNDPIVYDCNRLFPPPPYPAMIKNMEPDRDKAAGLLLSAECVNTINAGLVRHHETTNCPTPPESGYLKFLKKFVVSKLRSAAHSSSEALEEQVLPEISSDKEQRTTDQEQPLPKIHTLFSAECTPYFDWQTVGLIHSFKKSGQPGHITRLLSCSEKDLANYQGMDLAPTHLVPSMSLHPLTGDWYPAINKPAAILHWLNHVITDVDYLIILDADMIMRGSVTPWRFGAQRGRPVSAPYNYLIGCDNELAQLHTRHPEACDKVGGVIIMHIDDVRALAPFWLHKTEEVRADRAHWATNITGDQYGQGWISEMYGYSFGAAEIQLRHTIRDDMMLYPGYIPPEGVDPPVLHYGLEFKVGNWRFDKADWRETDMTNFCWKMFPPPPDVSSLTNSDVGERRRDEISIECVNTINEALYIHHRTHGCGQLLNKEASKKEQSVEVSKKEQNVEVSKKEESVEVSKKRPIISLSPRYWMVALWTLLVSCFLLAVSAVYSRQRRAEAKKSSGRTKQKRPPAQDENGDQP